MQDNIIKSIQYVELINNITSILNDLLYSPEHGYTNLSGKDAVLNYDVVVEKFDNEILKLTKKVNFSDVDNIIKIHKQKLLSYIQEHYDKQKIVWAHDVFEDSIENLIFELILNKDNFQEIFCKISDLVDWFCSAIKADKSHRSLIMAKCDERLKEALKTDDFEYLNQNFKEIRTKPSDFLEVWYEILNSEKFSLNLNDLKDRFSINDIDYFKKIKAKIELNQKTAILDEMNLISSAINIMKISDKEEQYRFILQVREDFSNLNKQNLQPKEEEKIALIKRRMQLFQDKNKLSKKYFEQLITS
ncbi:MAG: hypothetical protein IJB79_03495 [Candidatus Gastranaerophilales bacterium]|nr:hypothetical protein [Candidatus Gastranaerophilales bacterium]